MSQAPAARAALLDGRYELIELIGAGGMAEVWRGRDTRLQRDVAVKMIAGAGARDPSRARKIAREAKAMAALSHANILAVYDYGGDADGHPFIVTELIDGPDLHKLLSTYRTLEVDRVREIMLGVLTGIEVAHRAGIVHGDLKPANVLMGDTGPKVGDFGVARIVGQETGNTTIAATPTFAAPEVLKGERATPVSDVYSAACLAFQLLTGRAPYTGANGWEVAAKHIEAPVPHVREFVEVPAELDAAIHRGMSKEPSRRFRSASEFARAFATPEVTVPVTAPERTERIGPAPDLAKVALFGPLWPWMKRLGDRSRTLIDRPNRAGLAILLVFLFVVALFAFRTSGPASVVTPDVRGKTIVDAVAAMQKVGLKPDISYRPITSGVAGVVAETVPAQGVKVPKGSAVHVIATAFAATPTPAPAVVKSDAPFRSGGGRVVVHKHGGHGKD